MYKKKKKRYLLNSDKVFLRIDTDFNLGKDLANFSFSTDQKPDRNGERLQNDFRL